MAYVKPDTFRLAGNVPIDVNQDVDKFAALAGMSKSQFVGVLVQFGLKAWVRAYSPEKLLTTDDWKTILAIGESEQRKKVK